MQKSMLLAALLAATGGAHAADTDLAALREQVAEMKKSYEQRIAALEQKLMAAESRVATTPPTRPVPVGPESSAAAGPGRLLATAGGFNPEVSLILQGQYKDMKNVPERQITGFWAAGGHDHGEGGVEGVSKRGFSVDHTELVLAANIDPYWRGQAVIAALDGEAEVEEAWFQSLAIGHGVGLKGGRFRAGIGYLNEQHAHAWDFADAPLMYQALFGEHASYAQDGVQLKWLAPTPVFLEFGAEVGRGAAFPGSERNVRGANSAVVFAHVGDDWGTSHSWRAGLSYLRSTARERETHFEDVNGLEAQGAFDGTSQTWLADFVWKWAPDGNPKYRNFKLQAEAFQRREKGHLICLDEENEGNACNPLADESSVKSRYVTRQNGWYVQGVYQFSPEWRAGLRYEALDSGRRNFGANAANLTVESYHPKRLTAMVDYTWSEFARLRLQFAQDQSMQGTTDYQTTLQYIMSLGTHGAHKF